MRFMKKRKICYISNFVNLKYLSHENVLTFLIGLFSRDTPNPAPNGVSGEGVTLLTRTL